MKLLLIHPELDTLRALVQAIAGTGDFTLNIASSEVQALSELREGPMGSERYSGPNSRRDPIGHDLVLLWLDLFAVKSGLGRLQAFLHQIEELPTVLVVPPNVQGLAEKLGALPVRDTWLLVDTRPETLRSRLAAFVRQNPASQPEQRGAPEPPSNVTVQDQAVDDDITQQVDADLPDQADNTPNRVTHEPDRSPTPSPRLAPPQPNAGSPSKSHRPSQPTGAGRGRPPAGTRWLGVWSASGGAGVTTVASALARLSGRPLVGLSEPGVSLALGVPPTMPWKALQAHSLTVILGPALYSVSADEALAAAQTQLPRLGP